MPDTHEPAQSPKKKPPAAPVSRAPAPPTVLRGFSAPPRPIVRTPEMCRLPDDYPPAAHNRLTAGWMRAEQIFNKKRGSMSRSDEFETAIVAFVLPQLFPLCEELCKSGAQYIRAELGYFISEATAFRSTISLDLADVRLRIEDSPEWHRCLDLLAETAEAHAGGNTMVVDSRLPAVARDVSLTQPPPKSGNDGEPPGRSRQGTVAVFVDKLTPYLEIARECQDLMSDYPGVACCEVEYSGQWIPRPYDLPSEAFDALHRFALKIATQLLKWRVADGAEALQRVLSAIKERWSKKAVESSQSAKEDQDRFIAEAKEYGYYNGCIFHVFNALSRFCEELAESEVPRVEPNADVAGGHAAEPQQRPAVSVVASDATENVEPASIKASVPTEPALIGAPTCSPDGRLRGTRTKDLEISRKRITMYEQLRMELSTVQHWRKSNRRSRSFDIATLKQAYPDFELWKHLSASEQPELLKDDLKPTVYAWSIVRRVFGLSGEINSREVLKKDRAKIRAAERAK